MKTLEQLHARLRYRVDFKKSHETFNRIIEIHDKAMKLISDMEGDDNLLTDENVRQIDAYVSECKKMIKKEGFVVHDTSIASIEAEYRRLIDFQEPSKLDEIDNQIIDAVYLFRVRVEKILNDFQ